MLFFFFKKKLFMKCHKHWTVSLCGSILPPCVFIELLVILLLVTLSHDFLSKSGGKSGRGRSKRETECIFEAETWGKNTKQCFGIPNPLCQLYFSHLPQEHKGLAPTGGEGKPVVRRRGSVQGDKWLRAAMLIRTSVNDIPASQPTAPLACPSYQARGFWDSLTNPTKTLRVVLPFHVPSELFWHPTSGREQQGALLSAIAGC